METIISVFKGIRYFFAVTLLLLHCMPLVKAQDVADGFASVSADGLSTTTGGAGGSTVTVNSFSALQSNCGASGARIIIVDGTISGSGSVNIASNKTIKGKDTNARVSGFTLNMDGVSNIIISDLKVTGAVDGIAARNTHHLWVHHCEIWDCSDGLLDITKASSYSTVSWCKFYYVNQTEHRFVSLIGAGGGTEPNDWGRNKLTYHHNWFYNKVDQRQPRLMYGQGHIYNNYYTSTGNGYCVGVGSYGMALIENNYFKNVNNPHQFMYDIYCHITATGNTYDNTTGKKDAGLGGSRKENGQDFNVVPFTNPPYSYSKDNASDIPSIVSSGAGPRSGTTPISVSGVTVIPASASIGVGGSIQLTATVSPSNATNKNVSWASGNTSIATVSSTGLVSGVAIGSATITATTQDGSKTATCAITVTSSSLPTPLIKLGFNENTGTAISSAGSVSAVFVKSSTPVWSTNVPLNGGTSSVDFGTTAGNYYVESNATISQLAGLGSFTVTGWVNCRNSTVGAGGNRIVSWINNGANGVDIVYQANGSLKVGINQWPDNSVAVSNTGKITTSASAPASNWKFFAVTYSGSTIQFYFGDNATQVSLDKTLAYNQGAVGATIGNLAIGHFNSQSSRTTRTDRMFKGIIDQVEIFSSVLSLQQIQTIKNVSNASARTALSIENFLDQAQEESSENSLQVYPNPAREIVNIVLNDKFSEASTIQMFDNMGRMLRIYKVRGLSHTFDIGDLPSGLYVIKVAGSKGNVVRRFQK